MRFLTRQGWKLVVAGLLTVTGCASLPNAEKTASGTTSREQIVLARSQARWDAMVAGQYEKAYTFITPTMRSTLPLDVFRARITNPGWIEIKAQSAACEAEVCEVSVRISYYPLPGVKDTRVETEKWILDGSDWWFVYRG